MQNLQNDLIELLKHEDSLVVDGQLNKNKIVEMALQVDPKLIKLLLQHDTFKNHFFTDVESVMVFDKIKFQRFVNNKSFLPDSYTAFKNKIGLTINDGTTDNYINTKNDVVLAWPHKDCVLEGGQTKEEQKRNEIFWNETLAPDEIDRLLDPKVFTNWKKYDQQEEHEVTEISSNDNLILKGNNLLALASLKKRYLGKIKLIYIDPPYNTGGDSFNYNDTFNHSTWLTFMRNRLEIACDLLDKNGVIFISIDDNEQAYIKVLMDEVFGKDNFVANIVAQTNPRGRTLDKYLAKTFEYIVVYTKNSTQTSLYEIPKSEKALKEYNKEDEQGKFRLLELRNRNPMFHRGNRPKMYFPIFINPESGNVSLVQDIKYSEKALPLNSKNEEGCWTWGKEKAENEIDLLVGKLVSTGAWRIYRKDYIPKGGATTKEKTLWVDKSINHENGKEELGRIFGKTPFSFPKSVDLIKKCLRIGTKCNSNDIVLDFFAGSGTTAQAVLELNREDNGNRKFILCEQMDYSLSIPVERVKKIMANNETFKYCELNNFNQIFTDQILEADSKEKLLAVWNEMKGKAFLSYQFDKQTFDERIEAFKTLSLDDQKKFLLEVMDKNQLYVNYSEINDESYGISEADKKLNKQFYTIS